MSNEWSATSRVVGDMFKQTNPKTRLATAEWRLQHGDYAGVEAKLSLVAEIADLRHALKIK